METMLREKNTYTTIDDNPIKKIKNRQILLFHIENKTDLLIVLHIKRYIVEMVYFLGPMICQKFKPNNSLKIIISS